MKVCTIPDDHCFPETKLKGASGIIESHSGYILIRKTTHPNATKNGYVPLHRLVMEKHLDRYLTKKEVVHHIDENKQNNSIKNLEIVDRSKHRSIHNERIGCKTNYDIREVKSLYIKGYSTREVAKKLGMSKSRVGDIVRELGISRTELQSKIHVGNPLNKKRKVI